MEHRFIATGAQFRAEPRATADRLLVSDEEVSAEPPFKLVGVVEAPAG